MNFRGSHDGRSGGFGSLDASLGMQASRVTTRGRRERPAATMATRRGRIAINAPKAYTFQFLHYPSVWIRDEKRLATLMPDNLMRKNIVYFNRRLDYGNELILRVEHANRNSEADFGFILGFTTCSMPKVFHHFSHFGNYCSPEKPCQGNSLVIKIKSVEARGTCIVIRKESMSLAKVTIHRKNNATSFTIEDDITHSPAGSSVFGGYRDCYPFIDLSGSVTSLRIVSEVTPVVPEETQGRAWNDVPGIPVDISLSSWRFNPEVIAMKGEGIERKVAPGNHTYFFNKNPFQVNNTLTFVVSDVDEETVEDAQDSLSTASMTFGLTSLQVDNILIESLPEDPFELVSRRFANNWFVSPDLIPTPVVSGRQLSIKRNLNGITLKSGVRNIQVIIPMDSARIVYPFFYFSGRVRKINVVSDTHDSLESMPSLLRSLPSAEGSRTRSDESSLCSVCLTNPRDQCVLPCSHVCLCGNCAETIMSGTLDDTFSRPKCPICRVPIERVMRLYFS